MIIQSSTKPDLLLPDMTFWTMTINQPVTEIYKNYKVLCPTILFAEIYNDASGAKKRLKNAFEVVYIDPWQILVKNELEGQPIIQRGDIAPVPLKSEQDMDKEEKEIVTDGNHRSVALALLLTTNRITYQPVTAITAVTQTHTRHRIYKDEYLR